MTWSDWQDGYAFTGPAGLADQNGWAADVMVTSSSSPIQEWAQRAVDSTLADPMEHRVAGDNHFGVFTNGDFFTILASPLAGDYKLQSGQRAWEFAAAPPTSLPPGMSGLTPGVDYGPIPGTGHLFQYETAYGAASAWAVAINLVHRTNNGLTDSIDVVWDVMQLAALPAAGTFGVVEGTVLDTLTIHGDPADTAFTEYAVTGSIGLTGAGESTIVLSSAPRVLRTGTVPSAFAPPTTHDFIISDGTGGELSATVDAVTPRWRYWTPGPVAGYWGARLSA